MGRLLVPVYFSVLCGLLGCFIALYRESSSLVTGIIASGAATVGFALASVKSVFETRKLYYEASLRQEELRQIRSRIHVPSSLEVEKYGLPFAEVDHDVKRRLEREKVRVTVRTFVEDLKSDRLP
jgi:hypothetical protein